MFVRLSVGRLSAMSMTAGAARRALEAAKGDGDFVKRYLDGDKAAFAHMQGLLQAAYPDDGPGVAADDSASRASAAPGRQRDSALSKAMKIYAIASAALALLWGGFVAYERASLCPDLGIPAVCDEPWRDVAGSVVLVFLDTMIVALVALAIVRASGMSRYALLVFSLLLLLVPAGFMDAFLRDNRDAAYCFDVRDRQGKMLPDCRIVWSNWVSVGLSAIALSQPIVLVLFLLDAAGKERTARRTRRKGT